MEVLTVTEWKAKAVALREIAMSMARSDERDAIVDAAGECDRLVVELKRRWKLD